MARTREKTILWNSVLAQGTGFFRTQTPQHFEARHWAWAHMRSTIDDAGREGADPEFLQACALYLAELAAVDALRTQGLSQDSTADQHQQGKVGSLQTPNRKTIHGVDSPGVRTAFDQIRRTRQSLDALLRTWIEARGNIGVVHRLSGDRQVDAAFVTLMKRLDAQINKISLLFPAFREQRGRPPQDDILHCLSGLRQHFENTIGTSQPLLHNLASSLNPPLPIQVTSNHLRSVISGYRKRHHTHGLAELESLQKAFKKLRHNFTSPA